MRHEGGDFRIFALNAVFAEPFYVNALQILLKVVF